jgi:hypothetical protein
MRVRSHLLCSSSREGILRKLDQVLGIKILNTRPADLHVPQPSLLASRQGERRGALSKCLPTPVTSADLSSFNVGHDY